MRLAVTFCVLCWVSLLLLAWLVGEYLSYLLVADGVSACLRLCSGGYVPVPVPVRVRGGPARRAVVAGFLLVLLPRLRVATLRGMAHGGRLLVCTGAAEWMRLVAVSGMGPVW